MYESLHRMDAYVDDTTGEFVDGLMDLVVGVLSMPPEHQPQPLSQDQADEYGHVDPTMWTILEDADKLTLDDDMEEIMRRVQHLRITDATIEDRFVRFHSAHSLMTLINIVSSIHSLSRVRFAIRNEDRRRGIKLICNGHLDPSTYTMQVGVHTVTGRRLLVTSMTCVASMRPQVYTPVCVYDAATGIQLPAPDSKCECVAQVVTGG